MYFFILISNIFFIANFSKKKISHENTLTKHGKIVFSLISLSAIYTQLPFLRPHNTASLTDSIYLAINFLYATNQTDANKINLFIFLSSLGVISYDYITLNSVDFSLSFFTCILYLPITFLIYRIHEKLTAKRREVR